MVATKDAPRVHASAARLYENGQKIWNPADRWNSTKRKAIDAFGRKQALLAIKQAEVIINVGSGSEPYDWLPDRTLSLDRFIMQVKAMTGPVVGDLEQLPFKTASSDLIVCIASVLNYVSAAEAIAEMSRVVRSGGRLLLHFESSTSFEHLGTERWGAPATCVRTINGGREDIIWIYSPTYIFSALEANGFEVLHSQRFHIMSALGLRLGLRQQQAALLSFFDRFAWLLAFFSDDIILIAEKS